MGPLAAYSIKSALLLALLVSLYISTLGRLKAANIRRLAILCICILSLILPISFDYGFRDDNIEKTIDLTLPTPILIISEVSIHPIYTIIAMAITIGIFIATIGSIIGLVRLLMVDKRTVYLHGHKLKVLTNGHSSPFCFCGSIYISEEDFDQLPEMILAHENSHISHLHFIDLFIGRILMIIQWWNPMAWLLSKEMQRVHEYQADSDVLEAGYDCKEYQYLLLRRVVGDTRYSLVSGLKHNELKNRLKMINREKTDSKIIIFLMMLIPASLVTLAIPVSPVILSINDHFSPISFETLRHTPSESSKQTLEGQPDIIVNGTQVPYKSIERINTEAIERIEVWKDKPEHPHGVVQIETKPGYDIDNLRSTDKIDNIEILGVGIIRKEQ